MGPGVKVVGAISAGNRVVIGANAIVNKSFLEPGIVIAGVPAKKIKSNPDYPATLDCIYDSSV